MKIRDLEFYLLQIDRSNGLPPTHSLLAALTTDSGATGWGEAPVLWRPHQLEGRRRAMLTALAGRSVFDIVEMLSLDAVDSPALASALEMASWDLVGRITGQPLCHLWGGSYRQHIPLAVRLPEPADAAERVARELAEHGFHSQILALTGDVDSDLRRVQAVVEAAGDRAEIHLDANHHFSMERARQLCLELPADGLKFLMDPLPGNDPESLARLARQTNIPLAMSVSSGPRDVLTAARFGATPFVVVDPSRVGGLVAAGRCAAVAEAAGMSISLAARDSLGVASSALLQLAASTPAFAGGNECNDHQRQDGVLAEDLEIADGMAVVPYGPGLGIEVDRTKIERYQLS